MHALTNHQGVDAVLDPVGGSNLPKSWRVLKPDGAMVLFGGSSLHPREEGKLGGMFMFVWTLFTSKIAGWFSRQSFTFYVILDHNDASKVLLLLSTSNRAHLRGASLGAELGGGCHGPIIVLVMARVRQNGESFLINSVISNLMQLISGMG